MEMIIIRVQTPGGVQCIPIRPSSSAKELFEKTKLACGYTSLSFSLYRDQRRFENISWGETVDGLGLKHGDMIYLSLFPEMHLREEAVDEDLESMTTEAEEASSPTRPTPTTSIGLSRSTSDRKRKLKDDEASVVLPSNSLIKRSKGEKLDGDDEDHRGDFGNKSSLLDEPMDEQTSNIVTKTTIMGTFPSIWSRK